MNGLVNSRQRTLWSGLGTVLKLLESTNRLLRFVAEPIGQPWRAPVSLVEA